MGLFKSLGKFCERFSCKSTCMIERKCVILETGNILDLSQYELTMRDVKDLNRIASKRKPTPTKLSEV